jgi:hypothetical protein
MAFQWLQMRITEEQERRQREQRALDRLPSALKELHETLSDCVAAYNDAFSPDGAEARLLGSRISVTVRSAAQSQSDETAHVEISAVPALPGFRIERSRETLDVEVGILAGDKLFYKAGEEYIGMEDLTRRILDRVLFPRLGE